MLIGSFKMKKVDCKNEIIDKLLFMENDDKEKKVFVLYFYEF